MQVATSITPLKASDRATLFLDNLLTVLDHPAFRGQVARLTSPLPLSNHLPEFSFVCISDLATEQVMTDSGGRVASVGVLLVDEVSYLVADAFE